MQPCPIQTNEATMAVQLAHVSHWEADGTCSYCGSLSPSLLFQAIEDGHQLGPTDKPYKVYLELPEPRAGQPLVCGSSNSEQSCPGWTKVTVENIDQLPWDRETDKQRKLDQWVLVSVYPQVKHAKFYFQHLTIDEQKRFVDLMNNEKLKIGPPGSFYCLPFFMARRPDSPAKVM